VAHTLQDEYNTLRDEILQVYREQSTLVFTSALPAFGSLLASTKMAAHPWGFAIAGLILLFAISEKVRSNYYKIFAIGSYLRTFHDRRGLAEEDYKLNPSAPGWHNRWRRLHKDWAKSKENKSILRNLGFGSARSDAIFILTVGVGLIMISLGNKLYHFFSLSGLHADNAGYVSNLPQFEAIYHAWQSKGASWIVKLVLFVIVFCAYAYSTLRLFFVQRYATGYAQEWGDLAEREWNESPESK
jgi:hypothetical protein